MGVGQGNESKHGPKEKKATQRQGYVMTAKC